MTLRLKVSNLMGNYTFNFIRPIKKIWCEIWGVIIWQGIGLIITVPKMVSKIILLNTVRYINTIFSA